MYVLHTFPGGGELIAGGGNACIKSVGLRNQSSATPTSRIKHMAQHIATAIPRHRGVSSSWLSPVCAPASKSVTAVTFSRIVVRYLRWRCETRSGKGCGKSCRQWRIGAMSTYLWLGRRHSRHIFDSFIESDERNAKQNRVEEMLEKSPVDS